MANKLSLLLLVALAACAKKPATGSEPSAPHEDYQPVSEKNLEDGTVVQSVDLDGDRNPDILNYYQPMANDKRRLVRKEIDENHDGKMDAITYFNDDNQIDREEMDRDFDGSFDWTDHFQKNLRVMSEADTDHDGKMDTYCYYQSSGPGVPPKIARKEVDTNKDGLIDLWEGFDANGAVTRTGRDTDGDGKMDVRDE